MIWDSLLCNVLYCCGCICFHVSQTSSEFCVTELLKDWWKDADIYIYILGGWNLNIQAYLYRSPLWFNQWNKINNIHNKLYRNNIQAMNSMYKWYKVCWSFIHLLKRYTRHDCLFKLCWVCHPDGKMKHRLFNRYQHPLRHYFILSAAVLLFLPLLKPQRGGRVKLHAARDALQTLPVCLPRLWGGRSQRAAGAAQTGAARSGTLVSNEVAHRYIDTRFTALFVCLFWRWDAPNATRKWSAVTWTIMR